MLKNLSNLGTVLNRTEKKSIHGGFQNCETAKDCYDHTVDSDESEIEVNWACQQAKCTPIE